MKALGLIVVLVASCNADSECPDGTTPVLVGRFDPEDERACRRPNGDLDGPVTSPRHHGVRLGQWRDNKQVGEWVYRFPDGKVSAVVSYRDGLVDGTSTFHTRDDRILLTAEWTAGRANGAEVDSIMGGANERHFRYGRRSGTWHIEALHETRTYAFDGTLIVWNGRSVPPPPTRIRLPDGRWLARADCNLATWDVGFASPCLDLFEAFQRCETEACRELALDGYVMAPPPEPFWKYVL